LAEPISRLVLLKKKAPQIIAAIIVIVLVLYLLVEITEDILIEGTPLTSGPLISAIMSFTSNVKTTVSSWGYPGIFGLMILEASSLPIPSEVVLPFSGYLVSLGRLTFVETLFVASVAAILGSLIDYWIGLRGVEALTKRRILGRAIFSVDQLKKADKWFDKYGPATVFLGRLIPGIRTLISFPAGAAKMPLAKFLAFTAAGCVLWNSVLIYVGYYLGSNWTEVAAVSHYIIIGVVTGLLVAFALYIVMRNRRRKGAK
jgi:membrane protein DedA with SNARE-associated domain